MRRNLPVTDHEYPLRDGLAIVSKTDTKGRITYVNPYFIEVSGFDESELLGAPHNIVRHPDMPPEAFADLWQTLKAGLPWTGLVKNRRKNGDYYWVRANVTPVRENGQTTGYLSVRTKPSRAQVEAAEALYRRMREGQAAGIVIRRGAVAHTGVRGWLERLRHVNLSLRIGLSAGFLSAMLATLGGYILWSGAGSPAASILAGVAGAGVLVCLNLWRSLHKAVVAPLGKDTEAARAIAGGELSAKFEAGSDDDVGELLRALQQMNVNLQAVIGDMRANAELIRMETHDIAAGNMDLAGRTESQASSLQQTAASLERFATTARQNAENAIQANQLAASASGIAGKGGTAVTQVGATMSEINESSKKIADIIGVIDSIAFQTNILALNAAVEAARAGEQGKGFAVVATEVRHLAQRSAAAAKEIKTLIEDSVNKVEAGNHLVDDAMQTMGQIVQAAQRVTDIVGEITAASREQSANIDQINQAVAHMDHVTQQNAALVEQAAAAAAGLEAQASHMEQSIAVFRFAHQAQPPAVKLKAADNVIPLPRKAAAQAKMKRIA